MLYLLLILCTSFAVHHSLQADTRNLYLNNDQVSSTTPYSWKAPTFGSVIKIQNKSPLAITLSVRGIPNFKELTPFEEHGYHDLYALDKSTGQWGPISIPAGSTRYIDIGKTENDYRLYTVKKLAIRASDNNSLTSVPDTVYLDHAYLNPQSWDVSVDIVTPHINAQSNTNISVQTGNSMDQYSGRRYGFKITMNDGATFTATKDPEFKKGVSARTKTWTDPDLEQFAREQGLTLSSARNIGAAGNLLMGSL